MRRLLLAPLVVLLVVVLGLTTAQAAGLNLVSGKVQAFTQSRCTNATVKVVPTGLVTTTGNATGISATGAVDAACAGQPAAVTLYRRTTGTTVTTFSSTVAAGGTFTATGPAFAATGDFAVLVTVGGWTVPATWSPPASCQAINDVTRPCAVTWSVTTGSQGWPFSYDWYRIAYTVTSTSAADNVQWRVTFDLSTFAWLPERIQRLDNAVTIPGTCVALPALQLQGGTTTATMVGGGTSYSSSVQMDDSNALDFFFARYTIC